MTTLVDRCTRRRGPVTTLPTAWLVQGNRATQVPPGDLAASRRGHRPHRSAPAVAVVLCG